MKTLLALVICLAAAQIAFSQQKETLPPAPSYEGKTLSEWIALTKDKDWHVRRDVALALAHFRPQAKIVVPALIGLLKDKNKDVRLDAVGALGEIGLERVAARIYLLNDRDEDHRLDAAGALGEIDLEAKIALEARIRSFNSNLNQVRANDAQTSEDFGPEAKIAVPALSELFTDQDMDIRLVAIDAIRSIGSKAKPAALALAKLLKDDEWQVRRAAADALPYIRPEAKIAVPALVVSLKDTDVHVRRAAAEALGCIGLEAKIAVPALVESLNDTDLQVRRAAVEALGCFGLNDKEPYVRLTVASVLGNVGAEEKAAVPALTELLNDKEVTVRIWAAWTLGSIGPDAKAAIPAITVLLKDNDPYVRRAAAQALEQIAPVLPLLTADKTWKLAWHDEFNGTKLDKSKWEVMPDAARRDGYWSPKAVSFDGKGHLVISTLKDGDRYIDGCLRTKGKFEHTFGFYVARVQLQKQPGHWSAFWMMPSNGLKVGSDGTEIDIYEKPWLDDRVQHTLHWDGYGKDHESEDKVVKVPTIMDGWHTFGLWWKPDEYIFYVDGKETWRTKKAVSQVPEYIKLSDEIGKWGGDIKKAKLPDAFLVDYVRVYDVVEKKASPR